MPQLSISDAVVLAAINKELEDMPRGAGFPLMDQTFITSPMGSRDKYFRDGYSALRGMKDSKGISIANKPIVKIPNPFAQSRDRQKGGGYQHIIPTLDPYTMAAVPGDRQMQGKEVEQVLNYSVGYINEWGAPAHLSLGRFNDQLLGGWAEEARNRVGPQLKDWAFRNEHFHMVDAINRGYSTPVHASASSTYLTDAGLSVVVRHNPNFVNCGLAKGSRRPTWSATTATYMQSLSRIVIQAGVNSSEFHYSAAYIRKLYAEAKEQRMIPVGFANGQPVYEDWIPMAMWNQLMADPEFGDGPITAIGQHQSEVLFANAAAFYSGMIIRIMDGVAGQITAYKSGDTLGAITATSGNATTVAYGPLDTDLSELNRSDPSVGDHAESAANEMIKVGYVVGGRALYGIEPWPSKLVPDGWDYDRKKGLSIQCQNGWFRPDIYNNAAPASATTAKSFGIMSHVNYSPN